jgi:hypothetical protein
MVKNRIVTAFDPEQTKQRKRCTDPFGAAGRKQLTKFEVFKILRIQIHRSLALIADAASPRASTTLQ